MGFRRTGGAPHFLFASSTIAEEYDGVRPLPPTPWMGAWPYPIGTLGWPWKEPGGGPDGGTMPCGGAPGGGPVGGA